MNKAESYITIVEQAIQKAEIIKDSLPQGVLQISGMSSPKVRRLLNNLIGSINDVNYLEIGLLKGSTFISALYNNFKIHSAYGIDNWSQFDGSKELLIEEFRKWIGGAHQSEYYEDMILISGASNIFIRDRDCFSLPATHAHPEKGMIAAIDKIDVYFYDGDHAEECQYKAFTHYDPALADTFIAIVDDWNEEATRKGTFTAFTELGYEVAKSWELPASGNGDCIEWWNGLFVCVINKKHSMEAA